MVNPVSTLWSPRLGKRELVYLLIVHIYKWAPSSEFVSSSIPSWQTLTAHAQPFRGARDLAFCLKLPLDSLLVWASSEGSGETARMRRLAWTFAARIGDKYQIRLTRSKLYMYVYTVISACFHFLLVPLGDCHQRLWHFLLVPLGDCHQRLWHFLLVPLGDCHQRLWHFFLVPLGDCHQRLWHFLLVPLGDCHQRLWHFLLVPLGDCHQRLWHFLLN